MWIPKQQVNYWSYILYSWNTWEKLEHNEAVHQLFIDFKKAYDSVRRETLYEAYSESKGRLVSKKNIFVRHIFYWRV